MKIGVEQLGMGGVAASKTVPSLEAIFSSYVEFEEFASATERFNAYGDKLMEAFENLQSLGRTAKQFGSTEGLKVLNELVGSSLGGEVSLESVKETAKKVWAKIKEFFQKIAEWIKTFFYRVLMEFTQWHERLKAMAQEYKEAQAKHIECKPWSYIGFKNEPNVSLKEEFEKLEKEATGSNQKSVNEAIKTLLDKLNASAVRIEVKSCKDAEEAIKGVLALYNKTRDARADMQWSHHKATEALLNAEKDEDIEKAKNMQKILSALVKVAFGFERAMMKSAASIMANGKFKPISK